MKLPQDFYQQLYSEQESTFEKLLQLDQLFLTYPFMLEIQYLYVKQLEQLYRAQGDAVFLQIKKQLLSDMSELLNRFPMLCESRVGNMPCVPNTLCEWIWTEVLQEVNDELEIQSSQILGALEDEALIKYLKGFVKKSVSLDQKLYWILKVTAEKESLYDGLAALSYLEQALSEFIVNAYFISMTPLLEKAYQVLHRLYHSGDEEDLDAVLINNRQVFLDQSRRAGMAFSAN